MKPEERLAYEARVRTRQVVLAAAAGVLVMVAVLVQLPGAHVKVNEQTLGLITEHKRITQDIAGSVIARVGLARAGLDTVVAVRGGARARPARAAGLHGSGRVCRRRDHAVAAIGTAIASAHAADEFVSHGSQTYPEANALITKAWFVIPQVAGYLGVFMVAIALVLVSLARCESGCFPGSWAISGSSPASSRSFRWCRSRSSRRTGCWRSHT